MSLPYNAPVKVHKFNRRYVLRDPLNKEVIEFAINSNALDYEKRIITVMQFIADLMNGRKSIEYYNDTKTYQIMDHLNAPEAPAANPTIPGLIANAEQAMVERTIKDIRAKEVGGISAPQNVPSAPENNSQHHQTSVPMPDPKPTMMEKVKAAVKRRGRPKKK